jgi:hypothetical protein
MCDLSWVFVGEFGGLVEVVFGCVRKGFLTLRDGSGLVSDHSGVHVCLLELLFLVC